MDSMPNSYDRLVDASEEKTSRLLNELALNIDPTTIRPFSDPNVRATTTSGPHLVPISSCAPMTPTSQNNTYVHGGAFKRNVISMTHTKRQDVIV